MTEAVYMAQNRPFGVIDVCVWRYALLAVHAR